MSVVTAKVTETGFEMAADSISVRGWTQSKGKEQAHSKLVEVNGMVIGSSGTCEEASLMQLFCTTRKPSGTASSDLLEFLSEFADWKKKKTDSHGVHNQYLFGINGSVFRVEGWWVDEVETFQAIGAGMDYALAALHLGRSAKAAVEIACELSIYCEPPVKIIRKKS